MATSTFPALPANTEPWFRQLAQVLEEAFPEGFDLELYYPLARILLDYCSFRTGGRVLGWLSGQHHLIGYHDMMVADSRPPDEAVVRRLRERLEAHGLKEWAAANEL